MANITVYPHIYFDDYCETNGINDTNVENEHNDKAFISIVNTPGNMKAWNNSADREHWFKEKHSNVLNLVFDDTPKDIFYKGVWWLAISPEDALKTVEFIEDNLGKDFIIHCVAGQSRSQAVAHFIVDKYSERYSTIKNRTETPNRGVLRELNNAYNKIHNIDMQQEYEKLFQ